ncbi:DinB family protein [uncultured Microscilla sp.]|uniref:DinB family protein n=1 Tax=uncultured Microscilla sp. TaxID=432653 RepID=UPI002615E956|nr:DinB family protein [uncultured Microscilla sp.]
MTDSIHSKLDIIEHITQAFDQVSGFMYNLTSAQFMQGPADQWSVGQHLHHLVLSTLPINDLLLGNIEHLKVFGTPERASWNYKQLVKQYQTFLTQGAKAKKGFVPAKLTPHDKQEVIEAFVQAKEALILAIEQWDDDQLDNYCIPHPLLGKLSVREMLFFTIYHTRHHLRGIKRLLRNILN